MLKQRFEFIFLPLTGKACQVDLHCGRRTVLSYDLNRHGESGKYGKDGAKDLMSFDNLLDGVPQRLLIQRALQTHSAANLIGLTVLTSRQ